MSLVAVLFLNSVRSAIEQKIGDYWSSCMDEGKVQSSSQKEFQPELQRINALKSKSELADAIAEQRRRSARGPRITLIPINSSVWDVHMPNDAPALAKDVIARLRTGK